MAAWRVWWSVLLTVGFAARSQQNFLDRVLTAFQDLPLVGRALLANHPHHGRHFQDENTAVPREYCFGELGCFSITSEFYHPLYRPINLPPDSRLQVNVQFTIQSREDLAGTKVKTTDMERVLSSSFRPDRPTKIIIHGFLYGRDMPWLGDIVRALLRHSDYNVVSVDWTDGSFRLYTRAVANSRLVGLEIAYFINWLKNRIGLNPGDVHIIGHSLGAHTSGYVGERVPGLGRITGLDPAEPYFQYMPPSVRLDPTDALFVDIIHSDSNSLLNVVEGYGLEQAIGHVDFYPNDGRNQPGCNNPITAPLRYLKNPKNLTGMWDAVQSDLGCHHIRAAELFTESIKSGCPFMAFRCSSYKDYKAGKCFKCGKDGSGCAPMGLYADSWPKNGEVGVRMFLSTDTPPKYCMFHYQIEVELGQQSSPSGSVMGSLQLTFVTPQGEKRNFDLTNRFRRNFASFKKYKFLVSHHDDLGDSPAALMTWDTVRSLRPCKHCANNGPDDSLTISRVSVLNVERNVHRMRARTGRLEGQTAKTYLCNPQGQAKVISGSAVQLVQSPTCHTPSLIRR